MTLCGEGRSVRRRRRSPHTAVRTTADFLYLFELNSEGQIEFEEFVKVVKELKVLVHEAEK